MLRVAILVHQYDPFDTANYWLSAISRIWRESNIDVNIVRGPRTRVEADLVILHVNLTVIPNDYVAFLRDYPVALNGGVVDISKRLISAHRVGRDDRYDGPVIVKTDRNYGGQVEPRLAAKIWSSRRFSDLGTNRRFLLTEAYRQARRWWRYGTPDLPGYRIFDSARDVPDTLWRDPELIVERFLPERRNGYYCVRTWLFLGDQERNTLFYGMDPFVKSRSIIGQEPLSEVPEAIRQRRRDLKFDFGKFDYAVVDGEPVLYDANRTPAMGAFVEDRCLPIAQLLAKGIRAFI